MIESLKTTFPNTDWVLVIVIIICELFAAFVIWRATVTILNKKEKKDKKAKLLAGLSALEKSRRTLLMFKNQYILQRAKNATRLAHYINNFELVEKHIKKPELQQNLATRIKGDPLLSTHEDKVDINIIKAGMNKLYGLSDKQIQQLYQLIFDCPELFNETPNASYSEKTVLTKELPEKLYFIANCNPGFLIGLEQPTEELNQLNFMIIQWNDLVKRHQAIKNPTMQEMTTHINYFFNFSSGFYKIGVDGTLMAIKISMDHLKEYANTNYKDHKSFEIYGKSFQEDLMPELDEASKRIKENLDSMRI